jgi:hypothetical protein
MSCVSSYDRAFFVLDKFFLDILFYADYTSFVSWGIEVLFKNKVVFEGDFLFVLSI